MLIRQSMIVKLKSNKSILFSHSQQSETHKTGYLNHRHFTFIQLKCINFAFFLTRSQKITVLTVF